MKMFAMQKYIRVVAFAGLSLSASAHAQVVLDGNNRQAATLISTPVLNQAGGGFATMVISSNSGNVSVSSSGSNDSLTFANRSNIQNQSGAGSGPALQSISSNVTCSACGLGGSVLLGGSNLQEARLTDTNVFNQGRSGNGPAIQLITSNGGNVVTSEGVNNRQMLTSTRGTLISNVNDGGIVARQTISSNHAGNAIDSSTSAATSSTTVLNAALIENSASSTDASATQSLSGNRTTGGPQFLDGQNTQLSHVDASSVRNDVNIGNGRQYLSTNDTSSIGAFGTNSQSVDATAGTSVLNSTGVGVASQFVSSNFNSPIRGQNTQTATLTRATLTNRNEGGSSAFQQLSSNSESEVALIGRNDQSTTVNASTVSNNAAGGGGSIQLVSSNQSSIIGNGGDNRQTTSVIGRALVSNRTTGPSGATQLLASNFGATIRSFNTQSVLVNGGNVSNIGGIGAATQSIASNCGTGCAASTVINTFDQ